MAGAKRSTAHEVFSKRLREARERTGLSQKALGIKAKIHQDSASARVNQYEQGVHAPDFTLAERLAMALNVPTSLLYERDDTLAELIQLVGSLSERERRGLIRKLSKKG